MKRVFICASHVMFSQGIECLLGAQSDVHLLGRESDPERALSLIKETQPDIILLVDTNTSPEPWPDVRRLLRECAKVTLIELNLQDNTIHVYRGERRLVQEVEDLLGAMASAASPQQR